MPTILRDVPATFAGCDVVVSFAEGTKAVRLLQLTDMQFIDAAQRRTPDRLRADEIRAWDTANFDQQCGNHIRGLINQTKPDLIFITGDIVYGSFDDTGTTLTWFIEFMDSFGIPWAPVFGNHDNESRKGVAWQCQQLENSAYCLFKRGTVSGNGNYSVGIAVGDTLLRVLYMIDSNGCVSEDPAVIGNCGIYPDQQALFRTQASKIEQSQGRPVPAFAAFHIPTHEFIDAEIEKGYRTEDKPFYTIGVDVPAKDADFGCKYENYYTYSVLPGNHLDFFKACYVDGVFVGHHHGVNTCISHEGIRWIFGLKTGQYDYHLPYLLGGTLVTLEGDAFSVMHTPSLVYCTNFAQDSRVFTGFFADDTPV